MPAAEQSTVQHAGVDYVCAPDDGRVLAIHVPGDFSDYEKLPPTTKDEPPTPAGVVAPTPNPLMASTKGHLTPLEWPLQVLMLRRGPGPAVRPHLHWSPDAAPPNPIAHQVLVCQEGRARVGVFTKEGMRVAELEIGPSALVLLTEGHGVEFLEDGTRLLEIKQGPLLGVDVDDKVDLPRR